MISGSFVPFGIDEPEQICLLACWRLDEFCRRRHSITLFEFFYLFGCQVDQTGDAIDLRCRGEIQHTLKRAPCIAVVDPGSLPAE